MTKKQKSLAQREIFSKEWDQEMEVKRPGWRVQESFKYIVDGRPAISNERKNRLADQGNEASSPPHIDFS